MSIALRKSVELFAPGGREYTAATSPENLTAVQHPAFVARPKTAEQVSDVVKEARRRGLLVSPQATGHGAGSTIGADTILIDTSALTHLKVDVKRRVASAGVGLTWATVNAKAEKYGLLGLAGSSPTVGIAGYTFGGGYGWLARPHGAASSALLKVEFVDGEGVLRVASESSADAKDRDALWAFRGGGGVGIATRLEFELFPVPHLYAGYLLWPVSALAEVVEAWTSSVECVGQSVATSISVIHAPPAPPFPPELQGVPIVQLAIAANGGEGEAAVLFDALASAPKPTVNTWGPANAAKLGGIHLDPPVPTPAVGIARWLGPNAPTIVYEVLASAAGPHSPLARVEVRHFANDAVIRDGAATNVGGPFALHAVGALTDPSNRSALQKALANVQTVSDAEDLGQSLGSWVEGASEVSDALPPEVRRRVSIIADDVDPAWRIKRSRFVA